jgi:hypothetical protein
MKVGRFHHEESAIIAWWRGCSLSFHRPLGISPAARDSHSLASPRMGKWKAKISFAAFPRGARDDSHGLSGFRTKKPRNSISPPA